MVKLNIPTQKPNAQPQFLRADDIKLSVVAKILNQGEFINIKVGDGVTKEVFRILVEIDGQQYFWIPNKTSLMALITEFGEDTADWVGKTILLTKTTFLVKGQKKAGIIASVIR